MKTVILITLAAFTLASCGDDGWRCVHSKNARGEGVTFSINKHGQLGAANKACY